MQTKAPAAPPGPLTLAVIALRLSSTFNALALLILWLAGAVIGPALVNVAISTYLAALFPQRRTA